MPVDADELFILAAKKGASDIHLSVGVSPSCRIDGKMQDFGLPRLKPADTEEIIKQIVPESLFPALQERGEMDFSHGVEGLGRLRVNAFRQRGTYAVVARLINTVVPSVEKLGLAKSVVGTTDLKRGLVLVTGPTGSGKSTTLSALLDSINKKHYGHIVTLEDPIEFLHHHQKCIVNQREMGVDSRDYASALRAALRQDPDVILVGEMRDLETISTAVTAAETGHLVYSTLHTIGAANTIDRVLDVFPPSQQGQVRSQLADVLQCVVSQQLLPKVGGGRVAAVEVMLSSPAIRNHIREGKIPQIATAMQIGKKMGMITMDDAIYSLYIQGLIESEVAIEFAQDQVAMSNKVGDF